ncbi:sugar ABC transporter permease [Paenibacillus ferrarius]|uniref:Sugar ABC transporter permease n=1 Tax=Paenibacillus ferrarius TaxID=1469647 RepID=A0A1V4HIG1_9BACL|nr:ABC transporter permease subunit [Paenibacillus ferrarius]OPH56130.1 sugar ABC transporter permease [Paenibacillus ferrarius]
MSKAVAGQSAAKISDPHEVKLKKISYFSQKKALYFMLLPGVFYLLLNNYLPMFGIIIAFKKINYTDGILGSPWAGLENFKYLFATADAWTITRNTLLYNGVFIILNLVFGVAIAILLNEVKQKLLSKFYQSVVFLPYFLSMVVVGYVVLGFLSMETGFINKSILEPLGFEGIDWYSESSYWTLILPIVNTWKYVGYSSVIYLAAIVGFDQELYEAATLDGASKMQQFRYITIPLLYPLIIITTLLAIGRIFYSDFGLFYQVPLNSGTLFPTTNVIDTYVYRTFLINGDIGMSSAAGLYQAIVGFVLILASNMLVRRVSKENALF